MEQTIGWDEMSVRIDKLHRLGVSLPDPDLASVCSLPGFDSLAEQIFEANKRAYLRGVKRMEQVALEAVRSPRIAAQCRANVANAVAWAQPDAHDAACVGALELREAHAQMSEV